MKADYHFHPNLQAKYARKRLRHIWAAFRKHQLDAVICAEHTFKNAPAAYRRLVKAKPANARTHVFPGAELVTKDGLGVDVIAFARDDWYDRHPRLLEPFSMSLQEMLAYLAASDLEYFIPHPYLIKNPLKEMYSTDEDMCAFLRTMPGYEAVNGCFLNTERMMERSLVLRHITGRLRKNLRECSRPSAHRIPGSTAGFVAVGSDAHHPWDIGLCVEIASSSQPDRDQAFSLLRRNRDISRLICPPAKASARKFWVMAWTAFLEACTRRGMITMNQIRSLLREEEQILENADPARWLGEEVPERVEA